jgi:hypothetical protein
MASLFTKQPPPPATHSEEWLKHVHPFPISPNYNLSRPFTWKCVLPVIFPFYDYGEYCCPADGSKDYNCPTCCNLRAQHADWRGLAGPATPTSPSMTTAEQYAPTLPMPSIPSLQRASSPQRP